MENIKIMPSDQEAERSVLGAILLDNDCLGPVFERLKSHDYFYRAQYAEIYDAIKTLYSGGIAVDVVTLMNELNRRGTLETVGGISALTDLSSAVFTAANLSHYLDILVESFKLRRLIAAGERTAQDSYAAALPSEEIIHQAEQDLFSIALNTEKSALDPIRDILPEVYDRIDEYYRSGGEILGVPCGYRELDRMLGGLQPASMVVLAARPSMGKSSFAHNIAAYAAVTKKQAVAVFSLEMSKAEVAMRLVCSEAGVNSESIKQGQLGEQDLEDLTRAISLLERSPLYIDDTSAITVPEVRSKCRRIPGLRLVIIDYLTLMGSSKSNDNRQQEVSELSRQIKGLARSLNVPVLVLSQLSRAAASRGDHRPVLSDLRESGAIEQDADVVMFIHRPGYYQEDEEADKTLAEIIVAKQRNGAVGTVELTWKPELTRFFERSYRTE